MFIQEIKPKIIKDSRGEKTIFISLKTEKGNFECSAPAGKSTGSHEVVSYNKEGIEKSLELLKEFCKTLKFKNFLIRVFDDLIQLEVLINKFEKNFGKMGGNVKYVLHGVFLKAVAKDNSKELWQFIHDDVYGKESQIKFPMPVGNCIGGGLHSKPINKKRPDFQEFLLIPHEESFAKAITKNIRAYEYAKTILKSRWKNDENAWRTDKSNEEILFILMQLAQKYDLRIGLDIAAVSFFKEKYYDYKNKRLKRDRLDQIDYVIRLIKKYDLFYIEDPLNEEDFSGFKQILNSIQSRNTLIVGDDLTTTNVERLKRAIRSKAINSIIIKPNQIGSLIEVKKVVELCKEKNVKMIFSHRSGETMDNILADYVIGFGGDFIKCGIYGKERLIKYKRIMDIEKSLRM
ncbi:MAG: enolase C-terminal domain-like protein [Candidatus Nanoarchaeia archaeon]|nr:enolase C-terminal domain-like protein [Candidatus Nanoarchaeia archaeon]MDD4563434.1 enolase C-terminal domain-like protein [Candidatus Nanoarchaeia archaeon]